VKLNLTQDGIHSIARQAIAKKVGARGLRRIVERVLHPAMFHSPSSDVAEVVIDDKVAELKQDPIYKLKDQDQDTLLTAANINEKKNDFPHTTK
jgi:ATP-dependent Clp protease ATP-binding subunit ClpX